MNNDSCQKASAYLSDYIRINTTAPPGNTAGATEFLARIFAKSGIPYRLMESAPGKVNIMAIITGRGEKAPVILLNHLDVVPADEKQWQYPPFGGKIQGEYLYGRGTIDMKSIGIFQLMAMLHLTENEICPAGDMVFLGCCDEEIGGKLGAEWVLNKNPELKKAQAVLNEGTPVIPSPEGHLDYIGVDVSEKIMFQLKLSATGTMGHASIPLEDNPNAKLVCALQRLVNCHPPHYITPSMKEYFTTYSHFVPNEFTAKYRDLENSLREPEFEKFFNRNPYHHALVSNTISLTIIKGGEKENVIPSYSEAYVDVRLLPGVDPGVFLKYVKRIIADDEVNVEVFHQSEPAGESSIETPVFEGIKEVYDREFPGVPVTPSMFPAVSDSRFFRKAGIDAYGFMPVVLTREEYRRMHGIDERISLENIDRGTRLTIELMEKLAR